MISIAFVLSFVGAAVVFILSIFIFTEISDSINTTYQDVQIDRGIDGDWTWKEHSSVGGFGMNGIGVIEAASPNRASIQSIELNSHGTMYFYKSFPKEILEGRDVKVTWEYTASDNFRIGTASIVDGTFDKTSFTDFPDPGGRLVKGNGILDSMDRSNPWFCSPACGEGTDTLDTSGGSEDDVSIFFQFVDPHSDNHRPTIFIRTVEIVGYATYTFDNNTILSPVSGPGANQYGTFTGTVVDDDPLFESTIPEALSRTNTIAFTVLGILPIVMFFALFTVLSPRVDGEI